MFGDKKLKAEIKELKQQVELLQKELVRKDKQIALMEKIMRIDSVRRGK